MWVNVHDGSQAGERGDRGQRQDGVFTLVLHPRAQPDMTDVRHRHHAQRQGKVKRQPQVPADQEAGLDPPIRGTKDDHQETDQGRGEQPRPCPHDADRLGQAPASLRLVGHVGDARLDRRASSGSMRTGCVQRAWLTNVSWNSFVHFSPSSMNFGRSTKIRSFGGGFTRGSVGTACRSPKIFWASVK